MIKQQLTTLITENNILTEQQKGCREGTNGRNN